MIKYFTKYERNSIFNATRCNLNRIFTINDCSWMTTCNTENCHLRFMLGLKRCHSIVWVALPLTIWGVKMGLCIGPFYVVCYLYPLQIKEIIDNRGGGVNLLSNNLRYFFFRRLHLLLISNLIMAIFGSWILSVITLLLLKAHLILSSVVRLTFLWWHVVPRPCI